MRPSAIMAALLLPCVNGSEEPAPTADGGGQSCIPVDRFCPAEPPAWGSPCAGAIRCSYPELVDGHGEMICEGGIWAVVGSCADPNACGLPPLAELCLDPSERRHAGGAVEVGPADYGAAFRPFGPDERIDVIWGPNGAAMIGLRVRVSGIEGIGCVIVKMSVLDRGETPTERHWASRVRLHCGESLTIHKRVFGYGSCDGPREVDLYVSVQGIGRVVKRLVVDCSTAG